MAPPRSCRPSRVLLARNEIAAAVRGYFLRATSSRSMPAPIQVSPANQTHLHGLAVGVTAPDGTRSPRYLHCSPEFAMKKLLAAGERRIFSLGHVFRDREQGAAACGGVHAARVVSRRTSPMNG